MVGGMFATPQSDGAIVSFDFLTAIFESEGVADIVDLVGVHPYGPDVAASPISSIAPARRSTRRATTPACG